MQSLRDIAEQTGRASRVPEVLGARCVHALVETAGCRACVDACPRAAWALDDESLGIDIDACDGCGLCAPACPQGAVTQQYVMAWKQWRGQRLALCACEKTGIEAGEGVVPCIHAFGLGDLLHLYQNGIRRLLLACADCNDCPRGGGARLQGVGEGINRALAQAAMPPLVFEKLGAAPWTLVMAGTSEADSGLRLTRRGFLHDMARIGLQEGMQQVGLSEQEDEVFVPPGKLLPDRSEDALWPFVPTMHADLCIGCDACVRLCPHQAIVLEESAGAMSYALYPANCSGCRICVDVCTRDAISLGEWQSQTQARLHLEAHRCAACGAPFHVPATGRMTGNGLCPICSQHNHHKNLYQVLDYSNGE